MCVRSFVDLILAFVKPVAHSQLHVHIKWQQKLNFPRKPKNQDRETDFLVALSLQKLFFFRFFSFSLLKLSLLLFICWRLFFSCASLTWNLNFFCHLIFFKVSSLAEEEKNNLGVERFFLAPHFAIYINYSFILASHKEFVFIRSKNEDIFQNFFFVNGMRSANKRRKKKIFKQDTYMTKRNFILAWNQLPIIARKKRKLLINRFVWKRRKNYFVLHNFH